MPDAPTLVVLGAGRVSAHLVPQLLRRGVRVLQVYNRTLAGAQALAQPLGLPFTDDLRALPAHPDAFLLAVSDTAIASLAAALRTAGIPPDGLVLHTSGATPATVLAPHFRRHGVFYPLQTFSKGKAVDFSQVPLCLHAADPADWPLLQRLGNALGSPCHAVDDHQRAMLHVAAVFANNFTNHLFSMADALLADAGLPFDLLRPLILETAAKVQHLPPAEAQTGPAQRGDVDTVARHLALLAGHEAHGQVYRLLTEGISERQ